LLFSHIEINGTWTAGFHTLPASNACLGIDDETVRDGLRIRKVDGLSSLQTSPKFSLYFDRTNLHTSLAKGTTIWIDESRLPNDGDVKITPFSFNL
jgi:hypothetical protein